MGVGVICVLCMVEVLCYDGIVVGMFYNDVLCCLVLVFKYGCWFVLVLFMVWLIVVCLLVIEGEWFVVLVLFYCWWLWCCGYN